MFTNALELSSSDFETVVAWNRLQFLGVAPISTLWLILAIQFSGYGRILTRLTALLLALIPVVTVILVLSNNYHHLIVSQAWFEIQNETPFLRILPGTWLSAFLVYAYIQTGIGAALLAKKQSHRQGIFRWQGAMILVGAAISVGASIRDLSYIGPFPQIRLTPLGLVIAIPIFIVTLIRARRADILPVARSNVVQVMLDSVIVLDIENRIIDLNPSAERVIGTPLQVALGKPITDVWPALPSPSELWIQKTGTSHEIRLGKGDHLKAFDVTSSPISDWHGQPTSHVLVLRDVTERVQAEEILKQKEEYFRALTENSTDVTIITRMDGTIQYISPSLERLFGRDRDEVVGKNTLDFIHPDDVTHLLASIANLMLEQKPSEPVTARFHDKSGKWHTLECVGNNMLGHPAIQGIVVNARDVTEREAAIEALRESEERYRLHFTHVDDVIYSFDSQLQISTVSPSIERHLGLRPADIIGKSMAELDILPPEYIEKAVLETMKLLSGERVEGSLYELIAKDGTRKTAEISGSPVIRDGAVIGTVSVARDVTERLQAEKRLKASLQEKEILLREIHHRVKNNLQVISSLLNLQSAKIKDPLLLAEFQDSQNRVRSMALIHEQLYRSDSLTSIDFGSYLRELLCSLTQTYGPQANGVTMKVEADGVALSIDTAVPCGLLINELVSNALKHAFPDGRVGTVVVALRPDLDGQILLTVRDDGVGIPAAIDYRKTTTLGLRLVNSLARQIGGTVQFATQAGTEFSIKFAAQNLPVKKVSI